ncbi:MAG: flavin reductase family protein [Actinomycetota bacterium]|nr:flavin reductase family protein [Actinomycetota bacterium]
MNKRSFDLTTGLANDHYKLLTGLVIPRPIGWIGTKADDGRLNLAPFSFFNAVSSEPPMVLFSAGRHFDRPKDSVSFAEASGVFTVNIVSEELADAMNKSSGTFAPDEDEFAIAGLTPVMGTLIEAPIVGESPANLECRVIDVIDVGTETRMVLGEVVMIHVREDALDGTRVNPDVIRAIGRLSGSSYVTTRDRFELQRPT